MSNLKNNFTSKLTAVVLTEKKGKFVYTGSFEDGTSDIIRTSTRAYVSVTQIRLSHWHEKDENGEYQKVDRTDFLFSGKPTPSLGKNEQHRVITTVQVKTGASAPSPAPEPVHEITQASATTAGWINDTATGYPRGVIRQYGNVIWIEPTHSETRAEAVTKAREQLAGIAPVQQACAEPLTDRELAAYQPKIILDAITDALQKPSHEGL